MKAEQAWLACTLLLLMAIPRPAQTLSNGTWWPFTLTVYLPTLKLNSYVHPIRVLDCVEALIAYTAWLLESEDQTHNKLDLCLRRMFYLFAKPVPDFFWAIYE
jgi:hypothetical protein